MEKFENIDSYIKSFPEPIQLKLEVIRNIIKEEAPSATEAVSYGMPTFKLNGRNLVHFAGYGDHIGFYPVPSGIEAFSKELAPYRTGKGTLRFSLEEPLPEDLLRKVVKFRVNEQSS